MTLSNAIAAIAACLLAAGPASAAGRARLLEVNWDPDAGVPPLSKVSPEGHTLTSPIPDPPKELVAHAVLTYDVSHGDDGMLSFLSDHPWVRCEAPEGLTVGPTGLVAAVCRAEAAGLARLKKETRVYLKADPPGGGAHRKFYWVFTPHAQK